jgi:hypothetical protein
VALYDADPTSALLFVKQKLQDSVVELEFTNEQIEQVKRLGGRASDLESVRTPFRRQRRVVNEFGPSVDPQDPWWTASG